MASNMNRMINDEGLRAQADQFAKSGGPVKGRGRGDTVPAKYTPGEFVVSNDMMASHPGLREGLHAARAQTLAAKGESPAVVNAKAATPQGLRLNQGGEIPEPGSIPTGDATELPPDTVMQPPKNPMTEGRAAPSKAAQGWSNSRVPPGVQQTSSNSFSQAPGAARPAGFANPGAPDVGEEVGAGLRSGAAGFARKAAGPAIAAFNTVAGHANAYRDPNVPLSDKLRIGGADATGFGGAVLGGLGGAAVGASTGPVGAVLGGLGGSDLGGRAGHALGQVFGGDDALRRNGYDPQHTGVDAVTDLVRGKGIDSFGVNADHPGVDFGTGTDDKWNAPIPAGSSTGGAGRGSVNPPQGTNEGDNINPNGVVTRDGNSFSGTDVKMGADGLGGGGYGVSTIDGPPGGNPVASSQDVINAAHQLDLAQGNNPGVNNFAAVQDANIARQKAIDNHNSQLHDLMREHGLARSAHERGMILQAYGGLAAQGDGGANERMAGLHENAETLRAMAANQTNRSIHNDENQVSLRNNENTNAANLMGHKMTNAFELSRLAREQANKDREFQAGRGDAAFTQNQAAEKDMNDRFKTTAPIVNGQPDPEYISGMKEATQAYINGALKRANAIPPSDPNYAQTQAAARSLSAKGAAHLDDADYTKIEQGMKMRKLNQQYGSAVNPFGGTINDTGDPRDWEITARKHGLVQDQYVHRNGATTPVGVVDRMNGGRFNAFGPKSGQFDELKTSTAQKEPGSN